MAERPEDGEKRGESGWTLFYATPVLSESDQKFRVRERKIERERVEGRRSELLSYSREKQRQLEPG